MEHYGTITLSFTPSYQSEEPALSRTPDAGLEAEVLDAALQLLDAGGMEAVSLRRVASLASTTTPTVYARFEDREALLWGIVARVHANLFERVKKAKSAEQIADKLLEYMIEYPGRLELMNHFWPKVMASDRPKPVLELAKTKLMSDTGCTVQAADRAAFAVFALVLGTAMLLQTGKESSSVSKALHQSCREGIRAICQCANS